MQEEQNRTTIQFHYPRAPVSFSPSLSYLRSHSQMSLRAFILLALILFSSSLLQVTKSQSNVDMDSAVAVGEEDDLGITGEDVEPFGDGKFSPAPEVETICVFPKNPSKVVAAGELSELLVGMKNEGGRSVIIHAISASVHLPIDHKLLVQNLSTQAFNNASVPPTAQATFPYIFAVSKFLRPGTFDLVGTIVYEIDQHPYQSTFYNGTVEVIEAGGLFSMESILLFLLGISFVALLGLWIRGQIQQLSKKSKKAPKVEVGTGTTDASMDEWLQGTAYNRSVSTKSKKKK